MIDDPFGDVPMPSEVGSGGSMVLPKGHYPMRLTIEGLGVSQVKATDPNDSAAILEGAAPYVDLSAQVTAGPWTKTPDGRDAVVRRWFYMSPGKGPQLHFLRGVCQAIAGQPADANALGLFGITIPGGLDPSARTAAFMEAWKRMQPQNRMDFMAQFLRVDMWSGKVVVVRLGIDKSPRRDGDGEFQNNRFMGFWPVDDGKRGQQFLTDTEFPAQAKALAEYVG